MADTYEFTTSYMTYIRNQPYGYPNDEESAQVSNRDAGGYPTGWHLIPGHLWCQFATPKTWDIFVRNYEAYHPVSVTHTVFNMIPLTEQLAIQRTNLFTAFNSCVYALGYTDDLYETSWYNYYFQANYDQVIRSLKYKEGQMYKPGTQQKLRMELPLYTWHWPFIRAYSDETEDYPHGGGSGEQIPIYRYNPSGNFWDPMNRPNKLMELRPGKNAITFTWHCHDTDHDNWYNLDQLAALWPYEPQGPYTPPRHPKPHTYKVYGNCDPDILARRGEKVKLQSNKPLNDYTMPDLAMMPVTPCTWFWKELAENVSTDPAKYWIKMPNLFKAGTEQGIYKYPIMQHFIKLIPLWQENGTTINCYAQICVKSTLKVAVKKRRSAIYCPTYGPYKWRDLYSSTVPDLSFKPAFIRYRTAGARIQWAQELGAPTPFSDDAKKAHPRRTPYDDDATEYQTGQGAWGTYEIEPKNITIHKDMETDETTVRIQEPEPKPRKATEKRKLYPDLSSLNMFMTPM